MSKNSWSFSHRIQGREGPFLAAVAALFLISTTFTVLLFQNLRPDIEELLPQSSPSLVDWEVLRGKIRGTDFLGVLVFASDPVQRARVQQALARQLEEEKLPAIAGVETGPGDLAAWGKKHAAFLLKRETLEQLEKAVRRQMERQEFSDAPFELLRKEAEARKPPPPVFDSAEDGAAVVVVHLSPDGSRMENSFALKRAVERASLTALQNEEGVRLRYTGPVENLLEEHEAIIEDLNISAVITVLLCGLLLVFFFGSVAATVALMVSLGVGTVITFAIAYFTVGYVNSNTAFLASIIVGNGINFGIMYLSRFMEERRKAPKRAWVEHLRVAQYSTWKSTWTAALAAGLAYGSLMVTDFRGFRQFAVIGLMGMVLCWIAAFTVLPALLLFFEKRIRVGKLRLDLGEGISRFVQEPAVGWATLVLALGFSVFSVQQLASGVALRIETDLNKVRNKESMITGSASLQPVFERATGRRATPILVWIDRPEQAAELEEAVRAATAPGGLLEGLVTRISAVSQLVPSDQKEKAEILARLKALIPRDVLAYLPSREKRELEAFLGSTPVNWESLPRSVRAFFETREGVPGHILYVEPIAEQELLSGEKLGPLVEGLREVVRPFGGRIAGQLPVAADIVSAIKKDGPYATMLAFGGVVLLVFVSFNRLSAALPLALSLCLGVLWLVGFMNGLGLQLNFINFIALPITFGIGVDYAVNLMQRYRLERGEGKAPSRAMLDALHEAGGAVLMASLTTIIGYGSLVVARNQGFVSLGWLAVLGELTCLFAALLVLPSIALRLSRFSRA